MISKTLKIIATNIPDFKGVLLIGTDGFTVDKYIIDEINFEAIIIEHIGINKRIANMMENKNLGKLRELTIIGDKITFILARITPSYFLALGVGPKANLGQCRYELKKAILDLSNELYA